VFVHVETRRRQHVQWATALLVIVCVISFVGLALMPAPQRMSMWLEWGTVPANIFDAKQPILPQLRDPALLRLFTALFIHLAWLHLLGNLLFLVFSAFPPSEHWARCASCCCSYWAAS